MRERETDICGTRPRGLSRKELNESDQRAFRIRRVFLCDYLGFTHFGPTRASRVGGIVTLGSSSVTWPNQSRERNDPATELGFGFGRYVR
jgi:hypothetical protein